MPVRDDLHENKDLVVAIVGVVVLSVLTASLFYLENVQLGPGQGGSGSGELHMYEVAFEEEEHGVDLGSDGSGTLGSGESVTVEVPVTAPNVTRVEVTLTWGSSGPNDLQMDELSLQIEGPAGATCQRQASGTSGSLTRSCEGVAVPDTIEGIAASTEQDALRQAAMEVPADRGATGTYTVTVTLEDTRDAPLDDENDWSLEAVYVDFHAMARRTAQGPTG